MSGKEIQLAIYKELVDLFGIDLVVSEWSVRRGAEDTFREVASYAPRLDIAVGPFNPTFQNRERDADAIGSVRHPLVELLEAEVRHQNRQSCLLQSQPPLPYSH